MNPTVYICFDVNQNVGRSAVGFRPRIRLFFGLERKENVNFLKKLLTGALVAGMLFCMSACAADGKIETRDLKWASGAALPRAEEFFTELPDGYSARYAERYEFTRHKAYSIEVILKTNMGWETKYKVKLTLVEDTTPPELDGLKDFTAYINGEGISYRSGVTPRDNCDGAVTLDVDSSKVNLKREGVYPVVYTATDAAGNQSVFNMTVTVLEREITEEMLNPLLDDAIDEIIEDGMSQKQKLRAIYDYVYDHIAYSSIADKSSWVSAAYEGLTTGKGDCYTYFALSKAFFERLGIENMDVSRKQSAVIETGERHFWNLVNLGDEDSPAWYHFDACHLNGLSKPWGFLMTDGQLEEYSSIRNSADGASDYFYVYDKDLLPETEEKIITNIR